MSTIKVLGLGNALVDALITLPDDETLKKFELPKGSMQLVDASVSKQLQQEVSGFSSEIQSGGSAANTIHGLAKLGIDTSFIGKIGNDDNGKLYVNDMVQANIHTQFSVSENTPTGVAAALITPDAERTFATFLGAAVELNDTDLNPEQFKGFTYFYIEGYLVQNHALIEKAVQLAKQAGCKIVLDLASYNVVESNPDFLKKLVNQYVDILFANEEEAKAFTGKDPVDALHDIAEQVEIAIVKIGKEGSLIKQNGQVSKIGIIKVKSVDSTGAGDSYAAGFLYGLIKKLPISKCGEIAALISGNVIEQIGARLPQATWDKISANIHSITNRQQ